MSDFKLYSINWQDGMLISQSHLLDQQSYFEELHRWYAANTGINFGLMRRSESAESALALAYSVHGSRIRVEVTRCQAVMSGGAFVEINPAADNTLVGEAELSGELIPVYLSVSATDKQPVGAPDPQEDVPRIPNLVNKCELHIGKAPSMPKDQFIPIASLANDGGEVRMADHFYPPCLSIGADERLKGKAVDIRNRLENIMSLSSRAYNAIASAGALADQSSSLQTAFKETMYHLAVHLASTIDDFRIDQSAGHPITLSIACRKLFRVFVTLLNLRPGLRDYLNEKFFVKQQRSEVGRFVAATESFLLSEYNHRDIGSQMKQIDEILASIRGIVGFLAQLKGDQLGEQAVATDTLTYGGKTYRNVAYGSARAETIGELSYLLIDLPGSQSVSDTVILLSKELFSTAEWNNMQVRLGLNDARGLGETDPIDLDTTTYGDKVALRPQDMLPSPAVSQVTLVFRGVREPAKFSDLSGSDLVVYCQ